MDLEQYKSLSREELIETIARLEQQAAQGLPANSWVIPTARKKPSGKLVTIKSHGSSISFEGREYKPDREGLIKRVPIEAVWEIENSCYWTDGGMTPRRIKFDIVEEHANAA